MVRSGFVLLFASSLLAAACADNADGQLYAELHAPLRSPCQATDVPIMLVAKLSCIEQFPSPLAGHPEFFSTENRPKSRRTEMLDGTLIETKDYNYDEPFKYDHAEYYEDGNIKSVTFPNAFPAEESPIIEFEYRDSSLIGAYATKDGMKSAETEILYDDGRRESEGLKTSQKQRWFYYYDDDGRPAAKLGGGSLTRLPTTANAEALALGCDQTVPMIEVTSDGDFGFVGGTYYFRDGNGRIETIVFGITPGLPFSKYTFAWEGDRLASSTLECSGSAELTPRKITYSY